MHKLQCVMMCVNQKEFKRIHWCSMREIRPRKMIKEDQKFKKLRARKTKRNMKIIIRAVPCVPELQQCDLVVDSIVNAEAVNSTKHDRKYF